MRKILFPWSIYTILAVFPLVCFLVPDLGALPIFGQSIIYLFHYFTYLAFIVLAFLGLYLNQTRIFLASLTMLGSYYFALNSQLLTNTGINSPRLYELISLALPLGIGLVLSCKEASIFSWRTLQKVTLLAIPFLFFAIWIADFSPSYLSFAYFHFIESLRPIEIPQLAIIPLFIALLLISIKHDDKAFSFMISAGISFFPLLTACHVGMAYEFPEIGKRAIIILSFLIMAILLLHTIFTMYWKRVYIDELTQIANRRALDEELNRLSGPYTIAMIDIDHFKKFNDSFGHDAGDDVLKVVAQTLYNHSTKAKVFRYGGEEFTLLFKGIDGEKAAAYADELRECVAQRDFFIRQKLNRDIKDRGTLGKTEKRKVQITVSMGLATGDNQSPHDTIKLADQGLYAAKEAGRNCVRLVS